jgi:hypothetical protein
MTDKTQLPIPEHWTPDEAIAVHELLEELIGAVWMVHGRAVTRRYRQLAAMTYEPAPPRDEDDDIPF